jgi:hypothetical protein
MDITTSFEIIQKGQTEPITLYVRDTLTGDLVDVYATSTWRLVDISTDTVVASGSFGPTGSADVQRIALGIYQYNFDAATYTGEYILSIRLLLQNGPSGQNLFLKSASSKIFSLAARLRLQVDKSRKSIKDDIENEDQADFTPPVPLFYGYSDAHMILYLEQSVSLLNVIAPYTGWNLDSYPYQWYSAVLIDGATIYALESQGVFAIDTDYSYSLGSNSLVLDHFGKLSAHLASLVARFQKEAVTFKQLYRTKGGVIFQFLPGGIRSARMLSSLPGGFWSRLLSSAQQ